MRVPDLSLLLPLCGAAFVAGVVDAIAGGGGLVTVPALLLAGLPPDLALGTNKGQAVFGAATALWRFWRWGRIDRARLVGPFVLGFTGALAGAALLLVVPNRLLRPVVLVLLVAVAAFLALRRDFGSTAPAVEPIPPTPRARRTAAGLAWVIGAYDGFFGPGTGTFLILASVRWLGDSLAAASAHAKVVNFASNLAAVLWFGAQGLVVWPIALPMAVAQASGAALGSRLVVRGGNRLVRGVVLAVVAALCAKLAWELVR